MATFIGLIPSKYTIYALYGTFGRLHLPNCRFYNFCICILMGLGGASPSTVFLLFFCVRLPRQGKQFSRLCRSRGFVVSLVNIMTMHFLFSWSSGNPCLVPRYQSSRQTSSCPLVGILILWRSQWW